MWLFSLAIKFDTHIRDVQTTLAKRGNEARCFRLQMSCRRVTNRITSVRTVCLATTFDLPKSPATVQEHHIVHFASRFESGQQYCFLFTFIYLTSFSPIFPMIHRPTAKTHFSGCVFGGFCGIFFQLQTSQTRVIPFLAPTVLNTEAIFQRPSRWMVSSIKCNLLAATAALGCCFR